MAEVTGISWCDSTFNAWEGCTKIGPGCDNCYAETRNERFHNGKHWGVGAPRLVRSDKYWKEPIKWNSEHLEFFAKNGQRQRVFCSSLADVFDRAAPEGQRERLWALIKDTPNLDWLILTKRIGNVKNMLPTDWGDGYDNVWLMITVVNQSEADRDIPKLLNTPAKIRGLSMEPLLGPVNLNLAQCLNGCGWVTPVKSNSDKDMCCPQCKSCVTRMGLRHGHGGFYTKKAIDWVIVGGESGFAARPMHPQWVRSIRDQCKEARIPFFFKQWGEWTAVNLRTGLNVNDSLAKGDMKVVCHNPDGTAFLKQADVLMYKAGKKVSGVLLDLTEHNAFPNQTAR